MQNFLSEPWDSFGSPNSIIGPVWLIDSQMFIGDKYYVKILRNDISFTLRKILYDKIQGHEY